MKTRYNTNDALVSKVETAVVEIRQGSIVNSGAEILITVKQGIHAVSLALKTLRCNGAIE